MKSIKIMRLPRWWDILRLAYHLVRTGGRCRREGQLLIIWKGYDDEYPQNWREIFFGSKPA